jgi:hypothetical protein
LARHQWRTEVRRYKSQVKGNVKDAQLKLAATNSTAESKPLASLAGKKNSRRNFPSGGIRVRA